MRQPSIALCSALPPLTRGLADALAGDYRVELVNDPDNPEFGVAPSVVVGVLPRHDAGRHERLAAAARRHGASLVCVSADAHSAWIGPTAGAEPGCLRCMELWTRSRWSAEDEASAAHASALSWSWHGGQVDILAAQLRQVLDGADSPSDEVRQAMLRFDARSSECSRHALVPHPDCEHCSPRRDDRREDAQIAWRRQPRSQPRSYRRDNPLLRPQRLIQRYVDPRIGFVRHIYDDRSSSLMPQVLSAFIADRNGGSYEVGCGRTGERAGSEMVSVLEALERYCGFEPRAKRTVVRGAYAELREQAADPRSFILHDEAQRNEPGFHFAPYDDALQLDWVWAHSSRHGQARLVPEHLAYYRVPQREDSGRKFVFDISNGCALGNGLEEATLHGLFEVIERDAFLCTWYGRITPVELDIRDVEDETVATLAAQAAAAGWDMRVFDMSVGLGVPAILVLVTDPDDAGPVKSLCLSGAHLDPEKAILGAMVEALTTFASARGKLAGERERAAAMLADPSLVRSMADHHLLYSHPASYARLDFLTKAQAPVPVRERFADWYRAAPPADLTEELRQLIARLLEVADDVLVVDQTSDEVARQGLSCVKVLAPGLLPMTFGHQHRRISLARVNGARRARGLDALPGNAALNPHPHNFP